MKALLTVSFFAIPTLFTWILASYGFSQLTHGNPWCGAICGVTMVVGYYCFYKTVVEIKKEHGDKEL